MAPSSTERRVNADRELKRKKNVVNIQITWVHSVSQKKYSLRLATVHFVVFHYLIGTLNPNNKP